jgi:hypothetical protein
MSTLDEPIPAGGAARTAWLNEAALAIDGLEGHLGGGEQVKPTKEGDQVRDFGRDIAEPKRPQLEAVHADAIDRSRDNSPVATVHMLERFRFYWMTLPVKLYARAGWGFNRLEARAVFDVGPTDGAGATSFFILPDPQFMTFFEGHEQVTLGIDGQLKARAALPPLALGQPGGPEVEFDAGGAVRAEVKTNYVLGPFTYRLTAAKIRHWGHGFNEAQWRLDGASYLDEGDPGLRVMLRVPADATRLDVRVAIEARRYFAMLEARLQEKIKALPEMVANFFRDGTPISAAETFDLSADL